MQKVGKCIFDLILVGIPSSLTLSIKNRGGFILLNKPNLLAWRQKLFVNGS